MSLIGQLVFTKMHKNLMIAKDKRDLFGNIHFLLTGDFFQFSPVLDTPLYAKSHIGELEMSKYFKTNLTQKI